MHKNHETLEHVAPDNENPSYVDVYRKQLKNSLGNFVVLPKWQNSSLKDSDWSKKRFFFELMNDSDQSSREAKLASGQDLGPAVSKELKSGSMESMAILEGLNNLSNWDGKLVRERGIKLAENVWDNAAEFLDK